MKKIILFAAGLFLAGAVNAQVKFGVKGGLDVSNVIKTNDDNFSTSYKTGFNAGVTLEIPLIGPLALNPEVLYAQKGYKAKTTFGDLTQRTDFVDVPVLAKIKLAESFHVVVGPQVSFLTSTTNTFTNGFSTTTQKTYNDDADNFRKTLIAGVVGFSIDLSKTVDFHARYALDLQQNYENGNSQTPRYRNQVFQFGLAFKVY